MEPFKNLLNPALVAEAGARLRRHAPRFDAEAFTAQACAGLEALEMKARALQICAALEATLPADFDAAAGLLEQSLAPPTAPGEISAAPGLHEGLRGWILWPVGEYIARRGQRQPERAMAALHALTQRFTAEFAIRPFIVQHPALAFATLQRWVADPSEHVRRLVSEGSRPRLPWGQRLHALVADPSPSLPLLRTLQDDPSAYVRRSVANHLNDIAKDHPGLVAAWLEAHLPGAPAPRRALLRHASRTLVKQGHAPTLQAWGLAPGFDGQARLRVSPAHVVLGGAVTIRLTLQSKAPQPQTLVVDYAVHHVKADGSLSPKVFKGWKLVLAPGETATLEKQHALKPVTTRRYHAGRHGLAVQVNGQAVASAHFHLQLPGG
ncbi:DNA alkylation repair protein [Rubrivivax rivuli]|uniref:DNA alkylation repair protein n=1 Tax=Rubrivivax rivuli TaxID=1862385 RepID=A0A437RKB6_9BURK|nr:DNA alkylation repair protein [Rubrivivax rivuli]RVU47234.1 DNA alkylation repair protein [Rubrivivax rivuli]